MPKQATLWSCIKMQIQEPAVLQYAVFYRRNGWGHSTSHIINQLNLKQLGTVMNAEFPALALIHDEVPKHPVRVYQGEKIGVFTSEVQFNSKHDVQFVNTVLEWFTKGGFDRLIIIDGLVKPDKKGEQGDLFGVGSISTAREMLTKAGVEPIQQGMAVCGICGYLLSEGERLGLDITAILAECSPMYPDARAAALAIEAVSELIGIEIPLSLSLIEDARAIENRKFSRMPKMHFQHQKTHYQTLVLVDLNLI